MAERISLGIGRSQSEKAVLNEKRPDARGRYTSGLERERRGLLADVAAGVTGVATG